MLKQIKIHDCIGKTVTGFCLGERLLISFADGTFIAVRDDTGNDLYEVFHYEPLRPCNRFEAMEAGVISQDEYEDANAAEESAAKERERIKDLADLKRLTEKYGLPDPTSAQQQSSEPK